MSKDATGNQPRTRERAVRGRLSRLDYEVSPGESLQEQGTDDLRPQVESPAARIELLTTRLSEGDGSTAFQSVVVAIAQALDDALRLEYTAAEAAISLAQREKLHTMVKELQEVAVALQGALNEKGFQLLRSTDGSPSLSSEGFEPGSNTESAWWFALSEAIQGLKDNADRVSSLVTGQVKGGAMRDLAAIVVRLLQRHRNDLLIEAERWIE
jgi:hypothetical protein